MSNEFTGQADLDVIRYAQVWEDHQVLEAALAVGPDDDVLSICSAGCNALSLLLQGPRSLTVIDVSAAQLAVLELKLSGIRRLPYEDFLVLLGFLEGDALARYGSLRDDLPEAVRRFWDGRQEVLRQGLIHGGRLERFFLGFQREILPRLHPQEVMERLLSFTDAAAQAAYFEGVVATPSFCDAYRRYFGRESLESRGRDPAQYRYVEGPDHGAEFLRRLRAFCTSQALAANPYMRYFLTGRVPAALLAEHGPPYLRPGLYERLRPLLPRLRLVHRDLGRFLSEEPPGAFSKANLSDIFEYMSEGDTAAILSSLGERLRPGGRIAYWNLLVARSAQPAQGHLLRPLSSEARRLHRLDRVPFYQSFHLDEVVAR